MKPLEIAPIAEKLDEIQIIVQQTRSELEFYDFEVKFFYNLLDKHLLPLIDKESVSRIKTTVDQLKTLEQQKDAFKENFDQFRQSLDETIYDSNLDNPKINELLQNMLVKKLELFKSFRRFKKVFFAVFEYLLHTEKANTLLYE